MKYVILILAIVFLMGATLQSEFQDRYIIAAETYKHITHNKYRTILRSVEKVDTSAAETMRDARRDVNNN
jgi:hypothetical protein